MHPRERARECRQTLSPHLFEQEADIEVDIEADIEADETWVCDAFLAEVLWEQVLHPGARCLLKAARRAHRHLQVRNGSALLLVTLMNLTPSDKMINTKTIIRVSPLIRCIAGRSRKANKQKSHVQLVEL